MYGVQALAYGAMACVGVCGYRAMACMWRVWVRCVWRWVYVWLACVVYVVCVSCGVRCVCRYIDVVSV